MARRRRPPRPGALTELSPLKIATQILLLQTIWYVCGTVLILFAALVGGRPFSADLVLGWRSLRGDTTVGWMLGVCWMCNSFIGLVKLLIVPLGVVFAATL
jgi:protein SYS1